MLPINPDDFAKAMEQLNLTPAEIGKALSQPNGFEGLLGRMWSMPSGPKSYSNDFGTMETMVAKLKNAKEAHEREKGMPPFPYDPPSRISLIGAFARERASHTNVEMSGKSTTRHSTVGLEPHVSKGSLADLRPKRTVAVQFGAEDSAGDVVMVSLYNYPGTIGAKIDLLDTLFPLGTVLAIKEPTLKTSAAGGSVPHVRVDCPSDVVRLTSENTLSSRTRWRTGERVPLASEPPRTEEGWKALGNKYFQSGWFTSAAIAYSRGLARTPSSHVLRLNRAMTYLKLGHAGAALSDCNYALAQNGLPPSLRVKALYRKAQALYGLGLWGEAEMAFQATSSEFPSEGVSCTTWTEKCRKRRQENETGSYNWLEMYTASLSKTRRLDVADYKGEIEVVSLPTRGGGRGVIATKDVVAGQLLLVSKAFVSAFPDDCDPPEILLIQNLITMTGQYGCGASLGTKVAERIAGDPGCAQLVYDLYAGPSLPPPPSTYILEQAPPSGVERFLDFDVPVDIARIEAVLSFNAFQPSGLPLPSKKESDHPSALFLLPSLLNHSCNPNAAWVCFGDVMVIRATRDIPKGSEVFISYRPGDASFIKREKSLRHYFDKCTCDLCTLDRVDGEAACKKRDTLEGKISTWNTVAKARQGLQNLEQTYKTKRKHHDSTMTRACFHLALVQQKEGDVMGFFHSAMSALQQAGLVVTDKSVNGALRVDPHLIMDDLPIRKAVPPMMGVMGDTYVQICIAISNAFEDHHGDERRGHRWAKAAAWLHDIRYEGGTDLFEAHLLDPELKGAVPLY
ncbi:hypothetical protein FRC04_001415 [Tulasnella sp. 424]|nr:hypothetical protein FRC04_001415 [Tulasnella sp. 424]KAG8968852.1 hypothetical protein FRC05_001338 [Tulasnella sp. 425]